MAKTRGQRVRMKGKQPEESRRVTWSSQRNKEAGQPSRTNVDINDGDAIKSYCQFVA